MEHLTGPGIALALGLLVCTERGILLTGVFGGMVS